ncbi:hypothetical protein COEREDRAFT_5543 [Coemansia reversa NRRL 1564]|uniref:Uncharacterized protein n=1 Tax=Coemansia reversa (strain ATCC 12441 / NRRL 1564) TaxID=763665 RepID=A0A2G5BL53_COERN|nr:hypothetical protein COEREDRAFT_5543 [Coemansia reversa NRRL 1564]|eukprot:PIA19733.1 hypothetical protein COEREDRAFT_5543 [Coemansia reversa NRRL 1564]
MSAYNSYDEGIGSSDSDASMGVEDSDVDIKRVAVVIYKPGEPPAIAGFGPIITYDELLKMVQDGNAEIPEAGIENGLLYGIRDPRNGWLSDFEKYKLVFKSPLSSDFDRTDMKLWEDGEGIDEKSLSEMTFNSCAVFHLYCHPVDENLEMFLNTEALIYKVVKPEDYPIEIAKKEEEINECNKAINNINGLIADKSPSDVGKEQLNKIKDSFIEARQDFKNFLEGLLDGVVPEHQSDEEMAS